MDNSNRLKVLVVDDTIVYRKIVSDVLAELPDVEVVGTANNGKIALSRIAMLKPDLITLDIEMPEMNGIEVLERIQKESIDVQAIMLSTLTHEGGEMTIKALELGAFDFIPKPQAGTMAENRKATTDALVPIIRAIARQREIKHRLGRAKPLARRPLPSLKSPAHKEKTDTESAIKRMARLSRSISAKSEIVTIGISTGGPNALAKMIPKLPGDIGVPILIVQHMPPLFTQSLAKSLNGKSPLSVREAADGDVIEANEVYIAPGGKQMKIVAASDGRNRVIRITDDPPENSCKPSADYLFRSVAQYYVGRATGVIMTGMGSDGTAGLKVLKRNGATIIAQDEATCTVYGMPKEPTESGIVDVIASLDHMAVEIIKTVKRAH